MKRVLQIFAILAAALAVNVQNSHGAAPPVPLPTPADLQAMHDAGEYRTCLQQIARALALKGAPASAYDFPSLLLLRGDCLLHLQDPITAREAYSDAEKSTDAIQRSHARAMILLIQRSFGMMFKSSAPADAPAFDIADHKQRDGALLALMSQIKAANKEAIDAALSAQTLAPIIKAAPTLMDLHALELTGSGKDPGINELLAAVGQRARTLMDRELDLVDQRISLVEKDAERPSVLIIRGVWWSSAARQGLSTENRHALRRDVEYADQIASTAVKCQRFSFSSGFHGEKWDPVIEKGMAVSQHARAVLLAE